MSRVQVALNVSDIDRAVDFYSKLLATGPAKRQPGYANFAVADPPLKLVLIEGRGGGTLNHLGVEVEAGHEVAAAEARLRAQGVATTGVGDTTCCYASKTETWVADPDGAAWEVYVKTGDAGQVSPPDAAPDPAAGRCCPPPPIGESAAVGASPAAGCC